jgi:hypothetical protein
MHWCAMGAARDHSHLTYVVQCHLLALDRLGLLNGGAQGLLQAGANKETGWLLQER